MKELEEYEKAKQDLKDVSKGGKDYLNCSFIDISIRIDRENQAKKKLIYALGEIEFEKKYN